MTDVIPMQKLLDAAAREYPNLTKDELTALIGLQIEVRQDQLKNEMKRAKIRGKAKGGNVEKQMELFQDGGLKDEGNTKDPVSGNDVPPGATQEEVRDDIPAQLSEGEFVFPADVVRYIGLEKLMMMRQEAKAGLKMMERMGQMGNADEATIPDDMPFSIIDIEIAEGDDDEVEERAQGGVIEAANGFAGTTTATNPLQTRQPSNMGAPTGLKSTYTAPIIPPATSAPTGGFKYKSPIDQTKKATYTGLFGGQELTQGPDEYRTFINNENVEIQIPFKNGKIFTGFTIPEGFKEKTEKVDTARVQTARIKSAKVSEGEGDSSGVTSGAVDPAGDPLSYSGFGAKDDLDKNMKEFGKMQFGVIGLSGIYSGAKAGITGRMEMNQTTLGALTQTYTAAKTELGLKGRDINTLTDQERADLNKSFERGKMAVEEFGLGDLGNVSIDDVVSNVNAIADIYGVTPVSTRTNINKSLNIGKVIGKISVAREKKRKELIKVIGKGVQQGFSPEEALGIESLGKTQQQDIMAGLRSGKGVNEFGGVSSKTLDDIMSINKGNVGIGTKGGIGAVGSSTPSGGIGLGGPQGISQSSIGTSAGSFGESKSDGPGEDSSPESGDTGLGSEGYSTAVGGFIPRLKKKTKTKKMKRGGLASR